MVETAPVPTKTANTTVVLAEALIWWHPAITHPIPPEGWRFLAVSETTGIARVFDIQQHEGGRWELLRAYE